jgi:hypothetical protein
MSSATAEPKATPRRDARPSTGRRIAVWVLIVLACLATVLALMVGYARRAVFDSDQFANRATAALSDESVRSLIGEQVTDQLVLKNESDLIAGRPLIESVVSSVVGGGAFTGAFRAGVRDVHRAVFDGDQHTVTLALGDVGTMVAAGLEAVQPSLARRVEATRRVEVLRRDIGEVNATAARTADTIRLLAPLLLLVAILCAAGALWLSADRRRTVVRLAVGAAVGGLLLIVAYDVARSLAVGQVGGPEARAAVGAVWDAFLEDLHTAAWILAGSGAVVAAAAASLIRPVELDAPLRARAPGSHASPPARRCACSAPSGWSLSGSSSCSPAMPCFISCSRSWASTSSSPASARSSGSSTNRARQARPGSHRTRAPRRVDADRGWSLPSSRGY